MKWNRLTLFLIALFSLLMVMGPARVSNASPPSGGKLIKKLQQAYSSLESFSCSFRLEFQWSLAGEREISEGTMEWTQGNRFRYETPNQVTVSDGVTLWRYSVKTKQVLIENASEDELGLLPRDMLFKYPDQFEITRVRDAVVKGRAAYLLEMNPKVEGLGIKELKVWIDVNDSIARRMEWLDLDGNRTTYSLDKISLNPEIPPSRFSFEAPQDAKTFDLR